MINSSHLFQETVVIWRQYFVRLIMVTVAMMAVVAVVFSSQPPQYVSQAVVTFSDWQAERLARRDDPDSMMNPANVGGAAADEMSRVLLILQSADLWQQLSLQPTQLSLEHKRRGNLVTLKLRGDQPGEAQRQLDSLVTIWDQQWRQQFIAARQALAEQGSREPQFALELQQAKELRPFGLIWLQPPSASEQSVRKPLWVWLSLTALFSWWFGTSILLVRRLLQ